MKKYAKRRAQVLDRLDGLTVRVDKKKRIGRLTLDRPPLNMISYAARRQINAILEEFGRDDDVGVVVIRGAGGVYTSGGNVAEFPDIERDGMADLAWNIGAPERCPKPVICAIEKYAMGVGFELAMACDFRLATEETVLALPEISIGMMPGSGGTHRVARVAGLTRAKDMIMLGRRIAAPEALEWGLLTRVVEDSKAMDKAVDAMAARLNSFSPLALKTVKRVLNHAYETGTQAGLEIEGQGYEKLRDSWDYKEGIKAFLGKRKARYRGR